MNNKICANCNRSNASEMSFCLNCGAELSQTATDELPATVMAGSFGAFPQAGQNFQQPNYQQPNFQQPSFQQPNFQTPSFQSAPESGGQTKKILLAVGGLLIGFILLAAGGVKLYKAFDDSESTPNVSPTPQNLYTNNNGNMPNTNKPTPSSSSTSRTITDLTQQNIGDWTLRDTITGDPAKDGFSGARVEKQFKYYNSSQAMVHLTIAEYQFADDAEKALRTSMQKFKTLKLKVGDETVMGDNNQNEIGITQTMTSANGKFFMRYWTNRNFLFRALGTESDVENLVKKSEN